MLDNVNISSQRLCYECLSVLIILKGPLDTNTYLGIGTAEKYKILALILIQFGDNCIQNIHLWRYIVRYTVGNLVLR